jgi:hypothetical protein
MSDPDRVQENTIYILLRYSTRGFLLAHLDRFILSSEAVHGLTNVYIYKGKNVSDS